MRVVVEIEEQGTPAEDQILDAPQCFGADECSVSLAEHQRIHSEDGRVGCRDVRHEEVGEAVSVKVAAGGPHREARDIGAAACGDLHEDSAVVPPQLVLFEQRCKMPAVVRDIEVLVAIEVDVAEHAEEGPRRAVHGARRRDVDECGAVVAVETAALGEWRRCRRRVGRHVHVEIAVAIDVGERNALRGGRRRERLLERHRRELQVAEIAVDPRRLVHLREDEVWKPVAIDVCRRDGGSLRKRGDAARRRDIRELPEPAVSEHADLSVEPTERDDVVVAVAVEVGAGDSEAIDAVGLRDVLDRIDEPSRRGLVRERDGLPLRRKRSNEHRGRHARDGKSARGSARCRGSAPRHVGPRLPRVTADSTEMVEPTEQWRFRLADAENLGPRRLLLAPSGAPVRASGAHRGRQRPRQGRAGRCRRGVRAARGDR